MLVEIERAAGETFRALGMELVADDDPGSVEELRRRMPTTAGRWWRSAPTTGLSATS